MPRAGFDSPEVLSPLTAHLRRRYLDKKRLEPKPPSSLRKSILEADATALMAIGLSQVLGWRELGIVPLDASIEQIPDCLIIDLASQLILEKVEVVHFTHYSHEIGIVNFLRDAKLSRLPQKTRLNEEDKLKSKAYFYPEDVSILCFWEGMQFNVDWEKIHRGLKSHDRGNPVYILVRVNSLRPVYHLVQVLPELEITEFDLLEISRQHKNLEESHLLN